MKFMPSRWSGKWRRRLTESPSLVVNLSVGLLPEGGDGEVERVRMSEDHRYANELTQKAFLARRGLDL